jgi:cytoskeleton protein RodZ
MSEQEWNAGRRPGFTNAPSGSPGARLRTLRNEGGFTVEQIASQLRLAPRQIIALESDDHAALPGMPIVRGFIRSYAKLLRTDPAPLLVGLGAELASQYPLQPREGLSAPFRQARVPSMTQRDKGTSARWLILSLVLVLAATALWASGYLRDIAAFAQSLPSQLKEVLNVVESPPPAVSTQGVQPESPLQSELPASPAVAAMGQQDAGIDDNDAVFGAVSSVEPDVPPSIEQVQDVAAGTSSAQPKPAPAVAPIATSPFTSGNAGVVASASMNALVLRATGESWLEIRRSADGKVLLATMVTAGESITFNVAEPISVLIGNSLGVKVTLRGAAVELKAGRANIARLNLK